MQMVDAWLVHIVEIGVHGIARRQLLHDLDRVAPPCPVVRAQLEGFFQLASAIDNLVKLVDGREERPRPEQLVVLADETLTIG